MRPLRRPLAVCLLAVSTALFVACAIEPSEDAPDPEAPSSEGGEGVFVFEIREVYFSDERSDGSAPPAVDSSSEGGAVASLVAEEAAAAEEEAGEGEDLEGDEPPRSGSVLLDLIVLFRGPGEAPEGVDVEFVHSDDANQEKQRYPYWIDTHEMTPAEERQVPVSLDVDDYENGDGFSVEWPAYVPPEPRS